MTNEMMQYLAMQQQNSQYQSLLNQQGGMISQASLAYQPLPSTVLGSPAASDDRLLVLLTEE